MRFYALFLFILFSVCSFSDEIELSFDDISKYVTSQNYDYKGSLFERDSQERLTGYLGRSFIPNLKLEMGTANTARKLNQNTQNYNYLATDLDMNIFKGGRDMLEENARQSSLRISDIKSEQIKYEVLSNARKLYWELVYQKEVIKILDLAISTIKENQKSAQKRISGGIATSTDKIDFEQSELQYQLDYQKAKILYQNLQRDLVAHLVLSPGTTLNTQEYIPNNHDHAKSEFAENTFSPEMHRDFQLYDQRTQLFTFQKTKLSRWWTPHIDLYAGYTKRTEDIGQENAYTIVQENGLIGGIRMTLEFDGFDNQSMSTSEHYQAMANDNYKMQKRIELDTEYINATKLFNLNHELVHASEENIKKSEHYLKNTREEYLRGIKNSPDVLQASQRLITAQIRFAEVKKDYQLAKVAILGLLGK